MLAEILGMRPMLVITAAGCAVLGLIGTRWLTANT
jgi:hypothetical protein